MNEPDWRIACSDPYGRERSVAIIVEENQVLLVPPPGQAAVLSGPELDQLTHALSAAAASTTDFATDIATPRS